MARTSAEARPLTVTNVVPPDIDPIRRLKILEQIHTLQHEYARGTQNKSLVRVEISRSAPERPLSIVPLSDLHLGHRAVDLPRIKELLKEIISNPDMYVILTGDEIEGYSPKHFNTSLGETSLNLRAQIDFFKLLVLAPLLMKHKILTMVGTYWAHVEWHADDTTLNMQEILTAVDMQDVLGFMQQKQRTTGDIYREVAAIQQYVPIIENGGILEIKTPDREPVALQILHNPKGRNKVDPLHGVRENAMQALRAGNPPDAVVAGHFHYVGTGVEIVDQNTRFTLVQAGTVKGTEASGVKDLYGVKGTFGSAGFLDQSILLIPGAQSAAKPNLVPVISHSRGELLYNSLNFRDAVAAAGNTRELLTLINDHEKRPSASLMPSRSRQLSSEEERLFTGILGADKKYVQPYRTLAYDLKTQLPFILYPIGNARIGSAAENEDVFYNFFNTVIGDNPHAYFVLLRNLLDTGLGKEQNRKEHLDTFVQHILSVSSQGLALMLSETLRQDSWKRTLGEDEHLQPLAPGTYLSELLSIPLVNQLAELELYVSPTTPLQVRLVDRPMQFTASGKPTKGLMTIEQRMLGRDRPHAVVSASNTHQVGISSIPSSKGSVDFIASGYTATEVATGPSKHISPAEGIGQGLIVSYDKQKDAYTTLPTATLADSQEFFNAILLYKGAELLDLTQKMKRKSRKPRA